MSQTLNGADCTKVLPVHASRIAFSNELGRTVDTGPIHPLAVHLQSLEVTLVNVPTTRCCRAAFQTSSLVPCVAAAACHPGSARQGQQHVNMYRPACRDIGCAHLHRCLSEPGCARNILPRCRRLTRRASEGTSENHSSTLALDHT